MSEEVIYRFMKGVDGAPSLHADARLALMAVCVATQQSAGFGPVIDVREAKCPICRAPGFNTGWGVFRHTCGAEYHNDDEGTTAEPCPKRAA